MKRKRRQRFIEQCRTQYELNKSKDKADALEAILCWLLLSMKGPDADTCELPLPVGKIDRQYADKYKTEIYFKNDDEFILRVVKVENKNAICTESASENSA